MDDDTRKRRPHKPAGKGRPAGRDGKPRRLPKRRDEKTPVQQARPSDAGHLEGKGGERIAKWLARAGIASRRDAETMIAAGRVAVNGRIIDTPATKVGTGDAVAVDGAAVAPPERTRLFLFHKPAGVVTTNRDPEGRKTVFDVLPQGLPRLVTVGRLDIATEGLLLLTNDGGLARVLELPSTGWLRRYRVRVHGKVDPAALDGLKEGIAVDGVYYGAIEAALDREQGSNAWLTLGLREGKNREVRNVLGALGLEVTRLIRVSYGPFQLGDLAEGAVRELRGRALRDQLGERLIAEAGADFQAEVAKPFSNKPVRAGEAPRQKAKPARNEPANRKRERERRREDALGRLDTKPRSGFVPRPERSERAGRAEKPARFDRADRPDRIDRRPRRRVLEDVSQAGSAAGEETASRLRERRPARPDTLRDKPAEGRDRFESPRRRSSNVWMAPGARPERRPRDGDTPGEGRVEGRRQAREGQTRKDAGSGNRNRGTGASSPAGPAPRDRREGGKSPPSRGKSGPGRGPRRGR